MKILQSTLYVLLFLFVAVMLATSPAAFCRAFIDGVTIWAVSVLPVLLPFALLAPLAVRALPRKVSVTGFLFGVHADGLFLPSLICGYPVGAKLISMSDCDKDTATKLSSFCSTPGPIFVVATVGPLLGDARATAILAVSQLVACVLCGLLNGRFHGGTTKATTTSTADKNFGQSLTDAILSVLSVGALIALVYMFTSMLKSLFPSDVSESLVFNFVLGLAEMTNGVFAITSLCQNLSVATTLCSALLAFGGAGVLLQSMSFLSAKGVKVAAYLWQKVTQAAIASIVSFLLCLLFLRL